MPAPAQLDHDLSQHAPLPNERACAPTDSPKRGGLAGGSEADEGRRGRNRRAEGATKLRPTRRSVAGSPGGSEADEGRRGRNRRAEGATKLRPTRRSVAGSPGGSEADEGAPGRIRTCDPRIRNPPLYPTELRARAASDNPDFERNPGTSAPPHDSPGERAFRRAQTEPARGQGRFSPSAVAGRDRRIMRSRAIRRPCSIRELGFGSWACAV
jgi:hypothetical protein